MYNELLEKMFGDGSAEDKFLNKIGYALGEMNSGYWFAGEQETADELILEFLSTEAPNLTIHVKKSDLVKYGIREK